MRLFFAGFAFIALLACSNSAGPSPQGTVFFKVDGLTCKYTGPRDVTFYIASAEVGTEALAGGATSTAYLTKPSSSYARPEANPVVWARIANYTGDGHALWTHASNIKVMASTPVTHIVGC